MNPLTIIQEQWQYLLSMLPSDFDLEASLREQGGLQRRRAVGDAKTLLRLALVYGFCGFSLRRTAAWAQAQGVAQLSDVALLKRLRSASPWLGLLLGAKLAERASTPSTAGFPLRLRLVDATTVSVPGSKGVSWRIHLGYDLSRMSIDHIDLTGPEGGETLCRFPAVAQDLLIGDRGYAHRRGMAAVYRAGGHFLVRLNAQSVPLQDREGRSFDLLEALRQVDEAEVAEYPVQTTPHPEDQLPALPTRLIAVRKSAAAAAKDRKKILQEAKRKHHQADARALEAAHYTFVLTSLPEDQLTAAQILELYRFRWQIEMIFKRLKGLLGLDEIVAKDPRLAKSFLCAKLLAALLLEDFTHRFLALSPWGFPLREPASKLLADPASPSRRHGPCRFGILEPARPA